GTGKTRVITSRICHLLDQGHPPEAILAVTFTNKAAHEMRERLAAKLPGDQAHRLTISTFHSFCVRLLRSDIDRLGYKPNFVIYDDADQTGLLRKIAGKLPGTGEQRTPVAFLPPSRKSRVHTSSMPATSGS
ncbi:MAG: UvrD-helicase domain-containing protein, partial [Verrucomicrobiia bacterium]